MTTRRSLFESISLSSTVGHAKPQMKPISADIESTPGTSDEEDLDPTEFLSSQSPELLKDPSDTKEPQTPQQPSDQISTQISNKSSDESILTETMNQSISPELFDSKFDSVLDTNDLNTFNAGEKMDSGFPLHHLQENYHILSNDLQNHIKLHRQAVESGNDNLSKIRSKIINCLHNLSENQYSLHEIYERESNYNLAMCRRFKKWDEKRSRILAKVKSIKSTDNRYGVKLLTLLDDNAALDQKIDELENKLIVLKAKKKLLHNEIEDTSSVLESRSSKYVNAFQKLDRNGHVAILETLKQNGLSAEAANSLIHTTPVDVTFVNHYNRNREMENRGSDPFEPIKEQPPSMDIKKSDSAPEGSIKVPENDNNESSSHPKDGNGIMGIQAYEIPQNYAEEETLIHHNQQGESDAYSKGFNTGFKQSEKVKQQLQKLFESYIKPLLEQKESAAAERQAINVDDDENTITTKLDLDPIITFLQHKVVAYSELSAKSGTMSTVYHKCSESWKDICFTIEQKEKQLEFTLLDRAEDADRSIGTILTETLDYLSSSFDFAKTLKESSRNILLLLIKQEADGLIKALSIMPNSFEDKRGYYLDRFSIEKLNSDTLNQSENVVDDQNSSLYIDSGSHSSYLYNVNSNAIENRIINNQIRKNKKIDKGLSNKQVKGE